MSKTILVVTRPPDVHAVAVAEALRRKGATVQLWQTADYPGREGESVKVCGGLRGRRPAIEVEGSALPQGRVDTVWYRRPAWKVDEDALHPADVEFADVQCRIFRAGLWDVAYPNAFWVNPPKSANRSNNKILQQKHAVEVGLESPDTLYSNDPVEIRSFIRACGGKAIFKSLWALPWRRENIALQPMTTVVDEEGLTADESLRNAPGIYQELVPKAFEVRLTVMGRSLFGARLNSQETQRGKLDWRRAYDELQVSPIAVPHDIGERCIELLRSLGLVFGCFDFVVTPDGGWVFLEVNQTGQFLFIERMADLPLLDAFSDFLIGGDTDFEWKERGLGLRYRDLEDLASRLVEQTEQEHVVGEDKYLRDTA